MNCFVLSLGSNSSDKKEKMSYCFSWLDKTFIDCRFSSVYTTKALNGKDADYLNAVAIIFSNLEYDKVCYTLKNFEKLCGRTSESKLLGNIPIDIDIVIVNGKIVREKDFSCEYFQKGWKQL